MEDAEAIAYLLLGFVRPRDHGVMFCASISHKFPPVKGKEFPLTGGQFDGPIGGKLSHFWTDSAHSESQLSRY